MVSTERHTLADRNSRVFLGGASGVIAAYVLGETSCRPI